MRPEFTAALFFLGEEDIDSIVPLGAGNINDTFTVTLKSGRQLVLQRINPAVFGDPHAVMRNMRIVLDHLHQESKADRRQTAFGFFSLYKGERGDWFRDVNGALWRLMSMIEKSVSRPNIPSPHHAEKLGRGLGLFHRLLHTLDPGVLADTLPDIHNTPQYLFHYDRAAKPNIGREDEFCSSFIAKRRHIVKKLDQEAAKLGHGIIHGDPKTDNFLFDQTGEELISLIDLDTVKPGLLLHDVGDALRSCCNKDGETPNDPEKICFDPDYFHSWLKGYSSEAGFLFNKKDMEHVVDSVRLLTFELGLRFYTDYLEGNKYFKVRHPDQNLRRALVQFYLVQSIEKQEDHLQRLVRSGLQTS